MKITGVLLLAGGALVPPGTLHAAQPVEAAPMVAAHNEVRAAHGVAPLTWSPTLAEAAGIWADRLATGEGCELRHDPDNRQQGENLFWGSPVRWSDGRREVQPLTAAQVVESWASEESDYDYAGNRCAPGKACGHYTQIVWRDTTQVGCAMRVCNDQAQVRVCRYSPPGNWVGRKPY